MGKESPDNGGVNKKEKPQKNPRNRSIVLYVSFTLLVLFMISGFWLKSVWDQIYQVVNHREKDSIFAGEDLAKDDDMEALPEIMNVLILGLDSRDRVKRADTIMLLSLNRRTGEINIVSVPRDMRVKVPGYGMDKINHAYAYGGVALTRQALEDFLKIKIDHYMATDFEGFVNIVDILGGIELEVEKRMLYLGKDVTIDLHPGLQHLDGEKALQYVRFRSDSEGDFGRVKRQQKFIKILLQEMIAFKNIFKYPRLLPELAQNMKTDLELTQAIRLVNRLKSVDFEEINTFTLPGRLGNIGGISYVLPQEEEIRQLVDRYLKGKGAVQS